MSKSLKRNWVILLFIFLTLVLRLWRLSDLFHFTYDEEIIAFVGKRMFVNGHIPLIGGVTPMHFHVAPYFYWLSGLFLYFSHLNPLGWGIAAAGIAVTTIFVLYKTGSSLFNKKIALLSVFFYTFSFYQNVFDRHYWGLVFDGMFSLLTLWSLHELLQGRHKYLLLLALVWFFGFHTDPSVLVLYLMTLLVFTFSYFVKKNQHVFFFKTKINFFVSVLIGAFLLSLLPLAIFDVRHDFSNSRGILQYIAEVKTRHGGNIHTTIPDILLFLPRVVSRALFVAGDTDLARQYSYCPEHAVSRVEETPWWILIPIIIGFGYICYITTKKSTPYVGSLRLLGFLFLSTYIGITLYGIIIKGDLFDHYLATLLPPFYLLVAYLLAQFAKKWKLVVLALLIIFALANLHLLQNAHHRFGFSDKLAAVDWAIAETNDQPFSLDVLSSCFRYNGYRYLFYLQGKEPAKSYVDANLTYLYDSPPAEKHTKYLVIFTNPNFVETEKYYQQYEAYKRKALRSSTFGKIEVLLIDNSSFDFKVQF